MQSSTNDGLLSGKTLEALQKLIPEFGSITPSLAFSSTGQKDPPKRSDVGIYAFKNTSGNIFGVIFFEVKKDTETGRGQGTRCFFSLNPEKFVQKNYDSWYYPGQSDYYDYEINWETDKKELIIGHRNGGNNPEVADARISWDTLNGSAEGNGYFEAGVEPFGGKTFKLEKFEYYVQKGSLQFFYDAFSNDKLFSDSYKPTPIYDGCGYEIPSKLVVKGVGDIDIGRGSVNDIIDGFNYTETVFNKNDYTTYIKSYLKKLKTHLEENNPERVEPFMKSAKEMVEWIMKTFDEFQFFLGQSNEMENAMIILAYYKNPEDLAPHFVYFADGLRAQAF